MNIKPDLDELTRLAKAGGHDVLLRNLDDASYGATSGEVLMAIRHHLRAFLRASADAEPAMAELAQRVIAEIDRVLP